MVYMGGQLPHFLKTMWFSAKKIKNVKFSLNCAQNFPTHLIDVKFYNSALEDMVLQRFKVLKMGQFAIFRPEIML